jgi:hypothetical protein
MHAGRTLLGEELVKRVRKGRVRLAVAGEYSCEGIRSDGGVYSGAVEAEELTWCRELAEIDLATTVHAVISGNRPVRRICL